MAGLTVFRGFSICRMLSLNHSKSCLGVHTVSPNLRPPQLQQSPLPSLQFNIARLTGARIARLNFGYTASESQYPLQPTEYDLHQTLPQTLSSRPQTHSYSLCDSPVGLLAIVLDCLRPAKLSIPPKPTSQAAAVGEASRPRMQNPFMESIPESVLSVPPPPEWTPEDVLDWTMMQWLPGPEAGLRWLARADTESGFGKEDLLWNKWSAIPLGISTFKKPSRESKPSETRQEETGSSRKERPDLLQPESAADTPTTREGIMARSWKWLGSINPKGLLRGPERAFRSLSISTFRQSSDDVGVQSSPPMWASVHQNLSWVRRHETVSRLPTWEVPDQVVLDIRDCFGDLMEEKKVVIRDLT